MKHENQNIADESKMVQDDPEMRIDEATTPETEIDDVEVDDSEEAEVADMFKKLQETEEQLEQKNKDYLLLRADFDNFRKRMIREKADLVKTASERVLKGILPIVDDFERGLVATDGSEDAAEIRKGFELIYNKLVKYLKDCGVEEIASTGEPFNDEVHEAIATIPAPDPELKGKVVDTTTKGYKLNDKVLRHAKVVVGE